MNNWQARWPVNASPVTLTIPLEGDWPATIFAKRVGDLAVHQLRDDEMHVTHVPTLTSFRKAVPKGDWSEEQLLNWCAKVQSNNLNEWGALRGLTPNNYSESFEVKRIIMDWCLSVDVV